MAYGKKRRFIGILSAMMLFHCLYVPASASEEIYEETPDDFQEEILEMTSDDFQEEISETVPDDIPEEIPETAPEDIPEEIPETAPEDMQEEIPETAPEDMQEESSEISSDSFPAENDEINFEPEAEEDAAFSEMDISLLAAEHSSALSDSPDDPNYIVVEKRFIGLSPEQIPEAFEINVSSDNNTYILDRNNTGEKTEETDGIVKWSWKIVGAGTGTYQVYESNESVRDYSVIKNGEGLIQVKAADIVVSVPVHETTCSHTNWPVRIDGDSNVLFAATLTQGGVAVISKEPLSASQRAAVASAVLKIKGPWKTPVYFYSIEEQIQNNTQFELNDATITYDFSTEEVIIGRPSNWQHVATLAYSISEAKNPEITLTNTYRRLVTEVTVTKQVAGSLGDYNKPFDFSVSVKVGDSNAHFRINDIEYYGIADFSLKNKETIVLQDIPLHSTVTVTETDYSDKGYRTSCLIDSSAFLSGKEAQLDAVDTGGHTIVFTNTKDAVPDTGILMDSLPYALLSGIVLAGTAGILILRKRTGVEL